MPESDTYYPHLREMLDDRFAELPDDQLESAFEAAFGEGVTPAEYEDFFGGLSRAFSGAARDLGRAAQQAAPVLGSFAQGAIRGGRAGAGAGPYAALAGALAGGVGSALQQHGTGAAKDIGGAITGVVNTAGVLTGGGAGAGGLAALLGGGQRGRGGPATNALRGLLGSTAMPQALNALFTGSNTPIPIGRSGASAPPAAFAGLLSALAREAEAETKDAESVDGAPVPAYLLDSRGQLVVDPANPEHRAARLLQLLAGEFAPEAAEDLDAASGDVDRWGDEGVETDDAESWGDELEAFGEDLESFDAAWDEADDAYEDAASTAGVWR